MSAQSIASYVIGQCTYYVARTLSWIPAGLGNAKDWLGNAQRKGLPTSANPHPGDVVVYGPGSGYDPQYGHVAVVQSVQGPGHFTVSEMNFKGKGVVDTRASTMQGVMGFINPPSSVHQQGSNAGQNPNIFNEWLKAIAGMKSADPASLSIATAGSIAPWISAQVPGISVNVSNPFQAMWNQLTGSAWRLALIAFGLVMVLIGLLILFRPAIENVGEQVEKAAPAAAVAA